LKEIYETLEIKKERTVMKRIRKLTTAFLVIALLVTSLISVPALAEEDEARVHRIAGASRYLTAVEVSKEAYEEAETVIIAAGANFPDALAASALAGKLGAPILLAEKDGFRAGTLEEIERLGAKKAIVLGGEKALGEEVDALLEDAGLTVKRIAGENRYETAALIAEEVLGTDKAVFLTTGISAWDALAIGPVAAMKEMPVLLTETNKLRDETKAFLVDNGVTHVTILGGEKAVSAAVQDAIPAGIVVDRVEGENREGTAIAIADKYFDDPDPSAVVIATRDKFADALVGGYFGAIKQAPLLLVYTDSIRENTEEYLLGLAKVDEAELTSVLEDIYVLGGEAVVNADVADELEDIGIVKSVAAIAGQVIPTPNAAVGDDQVALKFLLNGKKVMTHAEFEASYGGTLKFMYNTSGFAQDGVIDAGTAGKYKYAVQYELGSEVVIPENLVASDFVEFEIKDYVAIVDVTDIGLVKSTERVDFLAVGETGVTIAAFATVDSDGKVTKDKDGKPLTSPALGANVTSNNTSVATYNNDGIVAKAAGTVTFTFNFADITKDYQLKVTVKEARKASAIANEDVKVLTGTSLTWTSDIDLLDQYGDEFGTYTGITVKVDGDVAAESFTFSAAKKYTVTVFNGDVQIGKFTVEAVTVAPTDERTYKLVFADEDETEFGYDAFPEAGFTPESLEINIEVYAKGVLVAMPTDVTLGVKSSDEKIAKAQLTDGVITVTPDATVKYGKVTFTLYKTEHDMNTDLVSIDVVVKDITPQIKKLVLADGVNALDLTEEGGVYTVKNEGDLVITDPETETPLEFSNDLVESIDFNETAGIAVITLKDVYGGKSFTFEASIADGD